MLIVPGNIVCLQVDKIFRIEHTDPWLRNDPYRTSRTVQLLNNRTSGAAIHGQVENEPGAEEEQTGDSSYLLVQKKFNHSRDRIVGG